MVFRLGLVGAGRMGRTHLAALAACETVRVTAIAEPDTAGRARLAGNGASLHTDLESMLAAEALDGVLVAVPTRQHLATVTRIATAGLPILCEKPCGLNASEARQAVAAGARLQVAYWRRFVPELQELRRRVVAGDLGELYHIACHQWDGAPPPPSFRAGSGGLFVDMGVHEFDQIRWLTGQDIVSLQALSALDPASPESAQALCKLSGGATALVSLGLRFPLGDICRVEVFGTHDAAEARFLWPPHADAVFHAALRAQAEAFAAWARGGPAQGASATDAVAALEAAELAMLNG